MTEKRDTPEQVREDVLNLLETEGLRAAAEAAIAVCRDPKAPAPARATASMIIMRATGLGAFGKNPERDRTKELHEMDGHELQAALEDLKRQRAARKRRDHSRAAGDAPAESRREDPGIFD